MIEEEIKNMIKMDADCIRELANSKGFKILMERMEEQKEEALQGLSTINPNAPLEIYALQNKIAVHDQIVLICQAILDDDRAIQSQDEINNLL